ncbi:MAG: preprotein translocase subunit SecG [Desulfococcaceae bacterium]
MSALLVIIHVIVCIALILIVLLQTGKGADMGAAFGGGGSQTLFGSTGAGSFLGKATTAAAVLFMVTSLSLAYVSSNRVGGSVMERVETTAPEETAPGATETPAAQETSGDVQESTPAEDAAPAE